MGGEGGACLLLPFVINETPAELTPDATDMGLGDEGLAPSSSMLILLPNS